MEALTALRSLARLCAAAALLGAAAAFSEPLRLEVEAPPALSRYAAEVAKLPADLFFPAMELTGLWEPGTVKVLVAPEGSPLARRAPAWAVAYADPPAGVVVLIPTRTPAWPDDGFDDVVRHEVAHVLTFRAAGGRSAPRWFDEGLAMAAGRERVLQDDFREAFAVLLGPRLRFAEVDRLFEGGRSDATRAYALSSAFFGDLLARYGSAFPRRVLRRIAEGLPFEEAFRSATGVAFRDESADFWRARRSPERWLPVVTSTATAWVGIVLLSAWAVRVVKRRRRARLAQWEAEERAARLQDEAVEPSLAEAGDQLAAERDEDREEVEEPPRFH